MRGQDLYNAIDLVSDKYIAEAYDSGTRKVRSNKRMYLNLLAATLVIAIFTACAAEVYKWDGRLSQVLNLSQEQETYVDGMWYSINQTRAKDGITITLDSVLADNNTMYLLYDVTLPEGMDMDRRYYLNINQVDGQRWFGGGMSGGSLSRVMEVDSDNNTITYLMKYSASSGSLREQKMRFWFRDLYSYKIEDDSVTDERLKQEVEFVFYQDVRYTPNALNYSVDRQVSGAFNTVNVENITVTPISLTIKAEAVFEYNVWDENNQRERNFVSAIILKDGTIVETTGSSTSHNRFGTISYKATFSDVINPKDIAKIEFFERNTVSLGDLEYVTGIRSGLPGDPWVFVELGILISLIMMVVGALKTLRFCRGNIYSSFEKAQEKRQRQGKDYTFDDFCTNHVIALRINEVLFAVYISMLLLGVGWLTYLILTNWFVTMTVFINLLCIGLILFCLWLLGRVSIPLSFGGKIH